MLSSVLLLAACEHGDKTIRKPEATKQVQQQKDKYKKSQATEVIPANFSNAYGGVMVDTTKHISIIPSPPSQVWVRGPTVKVRKMTTEELNNLKTQQLANDRRIYDMQADKRFSKEEQVRNKNTANENKNLNLNRFKVQAPGFGPATNKQNNNPTQN